MEEGAIHLAVNDDLVFEGKAEPDGTSWTNKFIVAFNYVTIF